MQRLLTRFHTLHWRLTVTYTVVSVMAIMLLEGVFWLYAGVVDVQSAQLPYEAAQTLERTGPGAIRYLDRTPPDTQGLAVWLNDLAQNDSIALVTGYLGVATPPEGTSRLFMVDGAGRVLVTTSPASTQPGTLLEPGLSPGGQRVLRAALTGDTQPSDLATSIANGRAVIASPIVGEGRVLGVLLLDWDVAAARNHFASHTLLRLFPTIVFFTGGAGIVGLAFGYVASRGLTRRLRRIGQAAAAWSGGEFGATVRDPSGDELGRLGRDLNQMAEQLQTLLQDRRQLAVVEERNRLARDLHDSVKQQVFVVSMQVSAARELMRRDPAAAEALLGEIERLIGHAQRELTGLIHELRPAALGDKGLATALRELGAEWSRNTGIAAEVYVTGERSAPLTVEQALFRVAQEALANVARHSAATHVTVQLAWDNEALTLAIEDNGHGFEVARRDGAGMGLRSMAERVEALGGTLVVVSGTTGTQVEARVPPRPEAEAGVLALEKGADA